MPLNVICNSLGLVIGALGRILAALLVLLLPLGGTFDFHNFLEEATAPYNLQCIIACRSRASSESPYIISFCIFVSFFSHPHLPNRGFPSSRASR